jgi:hypothetical protein
MRSANLALSFLLELGALAALAYWGWQTTDDPVGKAVVAVGAPLVMAVIWGAFVAPRAAVRVRPTLKAALSLLILETAAVAVIVAGQLDVGGLFAALILANAALATWWRQHPA